MRVSSANNPRRQMPLQVRTRCGLWIGTVLAAANLLFSASLTAAELNKPAAAEVRFESDILPLLQAKCVRCHGGKEPQGELNLSTLALTLQGGDSGAAVVPGKPEASLLYEKIHNGTMPPEKKNRLGEAEVELVRRWILAGARSTLTAPVKGAVHSDVTPKLPAVTQLDVEPILLRRCAACHGLRKQDGNLDVRTKAALLRGGKSGPAIVLGKPEQSLLIKRIQSGEMPPAHRLVEVSIKQIESSETDLLTRWIQGGAPEVTAVPDVAGSGPDPLVTDKDREFWAFRAPRRPDVPKVPGTTKTLNPIDAFVTAQQLRQKPPLTPAPQADRLTLLRRVTFDLTGMPPSWEDVDKFLADQSPDAYEKLVDRLLASPRYGERWGRYWLDLAGYADSEGKREQDMPRAHAWRYRDYVIRAFNSDKPYDRFLLEQIAGDELADYEHGPITPEVYDNLVATGFLRMAPDATWANITAFVPDRLDVVTDELDILGSSVLGLTLKCAKCHNHKFDPIPQRDYYRVVDVFKGAYDEYDWLKPEEPGEFAFLAPGVVRARNLPFVTEAERRQIAAHNAPLLATRKGLVVDLDQRTKARAARYLEEELAKLPENLRADLRKMLATPAKQRTDVQRYLAEKFEYQLTPGVGRLKEADAEFRRQVEPLEGRIKKLEAQLDPEPAIRALWDRGTPSPTYIYRRGDPQNIGKLVGPGVPVVLTDGKTAFNPKAPWPGAKKTGRRLEFARWLTRPDHPLTARVLVNRIWKHHFGNGIVRTLGNFGKAGSPPTHPELLDWLATEFVRQGWSIKRLHRQMLTSAAYRQSSAVSTEAGKLDPENRLLTRMPLTRLDAEALYDSMLLVAGKLDETPFGRPDRVTVRSDGLVTPKGTDRGWRRLIYVQQARKSIPTHLESFDYPQMNPNCLERRDSIVPTQALYLMNDGLVYQLAEQFARRVQKEAGQDPASQIDRAFRIALSRPPTAEELAATLKVLKAAPATTAKRSTAAPEGPGLPLVSVCHALVNSASFLFVD